MAPARTDVVEERARELLRLPYNRVIVPDGDGFSAEILEFPGCFAEGDTFNEAYRNLESVAQSWLEVELAKGASIPEPLRQKTGGGSLLWRLPRSLHGRLKLAAALDGVSVNQYLTAVVAQHLGATVIRDVQPATPTNVAAIAVSIQARIGGSSEIVEMPYPNQLANLGDQSREMLRLTLTGGATRAAAQQQAAAGELLVERAS